MDLIANRNGNYRFLTGIAPYSSGVVANEGYEIVHVNLKSPTPYQLGFGVIERHLKERNRSRYALCGIELRSPKPFTFEGFFEFNRTYREILSEWDLLVDDKNPIARTNIAPGVRPPEEPSLDAFSYTEPCAHPGHCPTFIVAGAGELTDGNLSPDAIIRAGETSAEAIQEKAAHVMQTMQARLNGLKATWADVTAVDVYTIHPLKAFLEQTILGQMAEAANHGVRWCYGRPPIVGVEFEMDMRGVYREIRLV
jgi:hypothetical protein